MTFDNRVILNKKEYVYNILILPKQSEIIHNIATSLQ